MAKPGFHHSMAAHVKTATRDGRLGHVHQLTQPPTIDCTTRQAPGAGSRITLRVSEQGCVVHAAMHATSRRRAVACITLLPPVLACVVSTIVARSVARDEGSRRRQQWSRLARWLMASERAPVPGVLPFSIDLEYGHCVTVTRVVAITMVACGVSPPGVQA